MSTTRSSSDLPEPASDNIDQATGVTSSRSSLRAGASALVNPPESQSGWLTSAIDLEHYAPAYFTFIATKLARGAAGVYRKHFGVGIEVWRVLVMLARDEKVSVNMVCRLIGMDKGSVSRAFKLMYEMGLISFSHDPNDGRLRYATLTEAGRKKHDEIKSVAIERQRALLSVLKPDEVPVLLDLLLRLDANLPEVEVATTAFLEKQGYIAKPSGK